MRRITLTLALALVLGIFVCSSAWANGTPVADDTGYYFLDQLRVDGEVWDGFDTVITTGQTYSVEADLSYAVIDSGLWQHYYDTTQNMRIFIDDIEVWSATSSDPYDITSEDVGGDTQINSAHWTLSGDLLFADLIEPEGVNYAFADRYDSTPGEPDGFHSLLTGEHVTMRNPVPEPGTILLLGLGLAGLVTVRRKKRRKI